MDNTDFDYKNIPGWNMDADAENEPTYPIKKWTGDDHNRINWQRPAQQLVNEEILHSNERPNISAVFGTPLPPSGLSGAIRRKAFTFSESEYGHWLNLFLADRINMFEGIIDDIKHGHFPNIFAERGMKADWKYNRKELVRNVVIAAAVTTILIGLVKRKK
ncbi:MAG TPA: hypothetical protein VEV62_01245 [Parafilimonas sp.]|nr:hypothetical protein [Parafilimonas sp.]